MSNKLLSVEEAYLLAESDPSIILEKLPWGYPQKHSDLSQESWDEIKAIDEYIGDYLEKNLTKEFLEKFND